MKIKKGDKVIVIAGADKGTTGEVVQAIPAKNKVVVEGVNIVKKALKPSQENPDGGIVSKEMPIHVSNVALYDSKNKQGSRVGYKFENNQKVRIYKKSGVTVKETKK